MRALFRPIRSTGHTLESTVSTSIAKTASCICSILEQSSAPEATRNNDYKTFKGTPG